MADSAGASAGAGAGAGAGTGADDGTAAAASGGALYTVSIHPLAILNITDHHTRKAAAAAGGTPPRVLGMLFGVQEGRHVDIQSSAEACYAVVDGRTVIDTDHFKEAMSLYTTVFPKHEMLGWYTTGTSVQPEDMQLHKQVTEFNDSPWFLFMNQHIKPGQKELPLSMYAAETHLEAGVPRQAFVKYPITIAAFEMERITIDHVSSLRSERDDESTLIRHLGNAKTAVTTLLERIALLIRYLRGTQSGAIPVDHSLLRSVAAICNQLPTVDSTAFRREYLREYNDSLLMTYLSSITKNAHVMNDLVDKVTVAHPPFGGRRRGGMY